MRTGRGPAPDDDTTLFPKAAEVPDWALPDSAAQEAGQDDPTPTRALDLLDDPPSTVSSDALDAALSGPAPSARAVRTTQVLGAGLVLALGLVGGVLAEQTWGQNSAASGPTADRRAGPPTGMPTGMPTGVPTGIPATGDTIGADAGTSTTSSGTVTLVDGSVLYMTDATGALVRVEVGEDASVTEALTIDLNDLDQGDTVTVTGTTQDQSIRATNVEVTR